MNLELKETRRVKRLRITDAPLPKFEAQSKPRPISPQLMLCPKKEAKLQEATRQNKRISSPLHEEQERVPCLTLPSLQPPHGRQQRHQHLWGLHDLRGCLWMKVWPMVFACSVSCRRCVKFACWMLVPGSHPSFHGSKLLITQVYKPGCLYVPNTSFRSAFPPQEEYTT